MIRLLAALLFIQSGVAVAHCLRGMSAGEGMIVEICTAEGMRTVQLDAHGEPGDEPAGEASFCPVCHGLPTVTLPPAPMAVSPAWDGPPLAWRLPGEAPLHLPAVAPAFAPRGPPITG